MAIRIPAMNRWATLDRRYAAHFRSRGEHGPLENGNTVFFCRHPTPKLVSGRGPTTLAAHVEPPTELIARPDAVLLDLAGGSRDAVLHTMHARLATNPAVKDPGQFLRDLLERVMLASVCIAPQVALPHARTVAVDRIVLAVARLAAPGVGFDAEHPAIRLVFLIGTPRQQVDAYLKLVAALSRLLRRPGTLDGLLAAKTEDEFRALLGRGAAS